MSQNKVYRQMFLNLNTNSSSIEAIRCLNGFNSSNTNIIERLSTGVRINSAADDAANLTLSEKLTANKNANDIANNNINTGIGKITTFDGYLGGITNSLQSIRTLAIQSINDTYSSSERQMLNEEATQLKEDIIIAQTGANKEIQTRDTLPSGDFIDKISPMQDYQIPYGYTAIYNSSDLEQIKTDPSGKYILMDDIDMSSYGSWDCGSNSFAGTFDGNGHVISNITMSSSEMDAGFFKKISSGATVKNLGFSNVSATHSSRGGVLGGVNAGTIENCYAQDITVTGTNGGWHYSGGLIGGNIGIISNSYVKGGTVSNASNKTGGLVGYNSNGVIQNCFSDVTVNANAYAGGLAGHSYGSNASIKNCYALGDVNSTNIVVGGLVGSQENGTTIENCFATGSVSGTGDVGGLVGGNQNSTINNCYSTGYVNYAAGGGLVGNFSYRSNVGSIVTNSYFDSTTAGTTTSWGGTAKTTAELQEIIDAGSWKQFEPIEGTHGTTVLSEEDRLSVQVGTNGDLNSAYYIDDLKLNMSVTSIDLSSPSSSRASLSYIDECLEYINMKRASAGTTLTLLDKMSNTNNLRSESILASNSTIQDTDMAIEATNLARNQILTQSSKSILQQSQNLNSQNLLNIYQNI